MDLQFYTTTELIDEILKRETFCGVIIKSSKERLSEQQIHDNFEVFTSLDEETTIQLIDQVKGKMENQYGS